VQRDLGPALFSGRARTEGPTTLQALSTLAMGAGGGSARRTRPQALDERAGATDGAMRARSEQASAAARRLHERSEDLRSPLGERVAPERQRRACFSCPPERSAAEGKRSGVQSAQRDGREPQRSGTRPGRVLQVGAGSGRSLLVMFVAARSAIAQRAQRASRTRRGAEG